jgi:hypothetical protein
MSKCCGNTSSAVKSTLISHLHIFRLGSTFFFYSHPCVTCLLDAMRLTTNNTTNRPSTTIDTATWLKSSGNKSKPLEGEVRVKKRSGPPKANTKDCDSSAVYAETMELADSTVRLYDNAISGTSGTSSMYL